MGIFKREDNSKKLFNEANVNEAKDMEIKLSLTETEEATASDIQKEFLKDEIAQLPEIKKGVVDISTIYFYETEDRLEIKAYIRNGYSKPVNFENIPLVILNPKKEIIAYQAFDLRHIGEIPPFSARPVKVQFNKANIRTNEKVTEDYEVCFDPRIKTVNYANLEYENIPETLSIDDREVLKKFLEGKKVEAGNIDFTTFNVVLQKDGKLLITVIILNGMANQMRIEKMPITVKDSKGKVIASALFNTENLTVDPGKARIHSLVFETGVISQTDIDMSELQVLFEA